MRHPSCSADFLAKIKTLGFPDSSVLAIRDSPIPIRVVNTITGTGFPLIYIKFRLVRIEI